MLIRAAIPEDAQAICNIWNPVIRNSTATFTTVEKTAAQITTLITTGHGVLVCEQGGAVTGFVTYGQFRAGPGYRHTAEHSIHVDPAARGQGQGRALIDAVCAHAAQSGFHSLWAGIGAENTDGVAFHARLGFAHVARLPQVGRKFDRWHDLILMQKRL